MFGFILHPSGLRETYSGQQAASSNNSSCINELDAQLSEIKTKQQILHLRSVWTLWNAELYIYTCKNNIKLHTPQHRYLWTLKNLLWVTTDWKCIDKCSEHCSIIFLHFGKHSKLNFSKHLQHRSSWPGKIFSWTIQQVKFTSVNKTKKVISSVQDFCKTSI